MSDDFSSFSSSSPIRPSISRSSSFSSLRSGMERYGEELSSEGLILLDVVETFFDSRLDLINRRLKEQSAKLRQRAADLLPIKGLKTPKSGSLLLADDDWQGAAGDAAAGEGAPSRATGTRGDKYRKDVEREVDRIKVKLAAKVTHLSSSWRSAQVVRTKEKLSFLFGVMSLTFSCIVYGASPEWLPVAYTVQSAIYLPLRTYTYKRKAWHYFLFDLCYFVNILDLLWIWVFPSSTRLFICCYLLTMGPIASAIITWRNSMVFHSLDKVISLFIHMYPPVVLTVINYVGAETRYPGLKGVDDYSWYTMILMAAVPYCLWQAAYYKFISIDRKAKIESGQRQTSFIHMLNDKRGPIGKALQGIRPAHRELWFMFGQLIYSIIFMTPPAIWFVHSPLASSCFLVIIFTISVWNGASFYVEVFGRKFERELEKLRKEMELASATGTSSSSGTGTTTAASSSSVGSGATTGQANTTSAPPTPYLDTPYAQSEVGDNMDGLAASPLVLPGVKQDAADMEVPALSLDKAAAEVDRVERKMQ